MLDINHERRNQMSIIAKDTAVFTLYLEGYILQPGDRVTFTVNSEIENENPLIQIVVETFDTDNNSAIISLSQDDTDLEPGNYLYDIQLDTIAGATDTVIGPAKFKVIGGVTY